MEIFGIAITLISLILAYQAWQNGKLMKQMHFESMAMIKSIRELNESIKEDIKKSGEETKALLERMDKRSAEIQALLDRMDRRSVEIQELLERMDRRSVEMQALLEMIGKGQEGARKEMANAIKYIADLIVADGERTRKLLRSKR